MRVNNPRLHPARDYPLGTLTLWSHWCHLIWFPANEEDEPVYVVTLSLSAYIFKFFQRTWEYGGDLRILDRVGKSSAHTTRTTEIMDEFRRN